MSFKCTGSWLTILCTNSSNPNPAKIKKKNNLPLSQSQWHCSKSISKAALDVLNLGAIYHTHKLEWFEINSVNCLPLVILIFSSRFPPKSETFFLLQASPLTSSKAITNQWKLASSLYLEEIKTATGDSETVQLLIFSSGVSLHIHNIHPSNIWRRTQTSPGV